MKLVPGLLISALVVSTPALAQNMDYRGTASKPGVSFQKDDTTNVPGAARKHMAYAKKHHSKRMKNSQPGPGNPSNPAASTTKESVTPKQ
jgi:hypothetical protein